MAKAEQVGAGATGILPYLARRTINDKISNRTETRTKNDKINYITPYSATPERAKTNSSHCRKKRVSVGVRGVVVVVFPPTPEHTPTDCE